MINLNLSQNQYSDFVNLTNNVFLPLKHFVNKKEFELIVNKSRYKNKFFPFPIFFGVDEKTFKNVIYSKKLNLLYKKKPVAQICNISFFKIDKKKFGKKIYGRKFLKHPFYKKFDKENYIFMNFRISKMYSLRISNKKFISPRAVLKLIDQYKFKIISSFHTRNVPHQAHQWIHKFLLNQSDMLIIQPLIGQYKTGEYKDSIIIKSNKVVSKTYKKKVLVIPFFSYPRYGGPREAALHALVRKNYGCSIFWVGRDHAGVSDFFSKYASQNFTKKNQNNIGIKIIAQKEPYYCKKHFKITNNCKCKKSEKIFISGSKIRKLIIKKKKVSEIFMKPLVSRLLNKKCIIN
tara:strand:+ start:4966 stop:6006 length:1041 start_codon:yes stop_codon:yes gene_type:complete